MSTHLSEAICERPPSREEIVWVVVLLITCRKPGMINDNAEKTRVMKIMLKTSAKKLGFHFV